MTALRKIELRAKGSAHGFIRRMVSPGDLGRRIKPFVFFDFVQGPVRAGTGFGFHPHSGIATLTYLRGADAAYEDTAGQDGVVESTGLEWMRAGGGTWHRATLHPRVDLFKGFQLWLALPPGVEDGPAQGIYVSPADVPQVGNVRVLLGTYDGLTNPIPAPSPITYLDVELAVGEPWRFTPEAGHTVAWLMVYEGSVDVSGAAVEDELVILDASDGAFELSARTPARVIVGVAKPHEHPLILGTYSVHTSREALARGEAHILAVREQLRRAGRL